MLCECNLMNFRLVLAKVFCYFIHPPKIKHNFIITIVPIIITIIAVVIVIMTTSIILIDFARIKIICIKTCYELFYNFCAYTFIYKCVYIFAYIHTYICKYVYTYANSLKRTRTLMRNYCMHATHMFII